MKVFFSTLGAVALAAGLLVACKSGDGQNSDKGKIVSQILADAKAEATKHPDGVNRITVAELKDAIAKGAVVVVDVRGQGPYDAGHIKGSIMIPGTDIAAHLDELPKDKVIVTYCS
jgi:3-mercaptopyruvate sulfurtransferase SseA